MANYFDVTWYTVPAWAVPALFNGDVSGLTDTEAETVETFERDVIAACDPGHWEMAGELNWPEFETSNDIDGLAGDCFRVCYNVLRVAS